MCIGPKIRLAVGTEMNIWMVTWWLECGIKKEKRSKTSTYDYSMCVLIREVQASVDKH